jgi:hypothetical protein
VAVDVDRRERERQTGLAGQRQEGSLELGAGVAESAPVEDLPEASHPALAPMVVEGLAKLVGADEPEPVRLVDRPLHDSLVMPGRQVDQGLDR